MPNYTMTRGEMAAVLADLKKVYEGLRGSDLNFAKSLEQAYAVRGMLSDKQMYWARKMTIKAKDQLRAKATGQATTAPPRYAPPRPVTAADLIPELKQLSPGQLRQMVQELEDTKRAELREQQRELERRRQWEERADRRRREIEREEAYWQQDRMDQEPTAEPVEGLQEMLDREFKERKRTEDNKRRVAIKAHEVEWQRVEKQAARETNKQEFLMDLETTPTPSTDGGGEICTICYVKGCRIGPMARY